MTAKSGYDWQVQWRPAAVMVLVSLLWSCAAAVDPAAIHDAQLVARVKTALVNDPLVGVWPIEVHVDHGVVRLIGRVASAADADRAVALARAVAGVTAVRADLRTAGTPAPGAPAAEEPSTPSAAEPPPAAVSPPPPQSRQRGGRGEVEDRPPHLLAIGMLVGRSSPSGDPLRPATKIGPLVRLGSGTGLGVAIGLGWFHTDWHPASNGGMQAGRLKIRPLMGGVSYGLGTERSSLSLSLVGGVALNSARPDAVTNTTAVLLGVDNSLVARPGVSLWLDAGRRFAINLAGGYVMTRPRVTVLEDGRTLKRRLRADTAQINAGLAYKLF